MFSAPLCRDATRKARRSKKASRTSAKPSSFILKAWSKTDCPFPRKTSSSNRLRFRCDAEAANGYSKGLGSHCRAVGVRVSAPRGSHAIYVRHSDQPRVVIPMQPAEVKGTTLRAITQDLKRSEAEY